MDSTLDLRQNQTFQPTSLADSEVAPQNKSFFRKWGSLIVLSLALAIIVIDTTLLNVSIRAIIIDLKTDIQSMQWVITAYSLMLAAFTITGGRLGDLFGRKKMFMVGAIIFALGSFIASISASVGTMIWGEAIIEGIGAALMMPATSSLLVSSFKGRDRAIAFGVWGGIAAAAAAVGPILGGYLTSNYSWRWGFRINIVVVAVLLIGSYLIKESRDTEEKPTLDFVGIGLSALGLLGVVFGIIESSRYGWLQAKESFTIGSFTLSSIGDFSITVPAMIWGIIFIVIFILWEMRMDKKGKTPLVSLSLFKNKQYSLGVITTGIMSLGQTGIFFSLPIFFQAVKEMDAFHTGLGLLPLSISLFTGALFSAFIVKKIHPKTLIITGLIINVIAYIVLLLSLNIDATPWSLAPGLLIYGLGLGLVIAQINNMTLSAVSVQEAGEASGVNNTFRQVGSSLGSAIIGAVLLSTIATNMTQGIKDSRALPEAAKLQIIEKVAQQSSSFEFGGGAASQDNMPLPIKTEILQISRESTVAGNKSALMYAAIFAFFGLIAALFLPKTKNIEQNISATAKR